MRIPGRACLLAALAVIAAGCSDRPKAPPLVAEAVYQNDAAGVRFLAPEGWPITSRSLLPPGRLEKPVVLVSYTTRRGDKTADFDLVAADVPADADLGRFLVEYRIGAAKWDLKPPAVPVELGGKPTTRYTLARGTGKAEQRREVTAVRAGERVYYFVISFAADDTDLRDQARKSVESATWTK